MARILSCWVVIVCAGLGVARPAHASAGPLEVAPAASGVNRQSDAASVRRAQSGESVSSQQQAAAQSFWSRFRRAVMADDMKTLRALTARPLLLKGETDSEPVRRVPDSAVSATLQQMLARPVFQGAGKPAPSLAQLIRDTEALPATAWVSPQQVRVHNLELGLVNGEWKLRTIYRDES
jgi:hypothetical protein